MSPEEAVRRLQYATVRAIALTFEVWACEEAERSQSEWESLGYCVTPGELWPPTQRLPRDDADVDD